MFIDPKVNQYGSHMVMSNVVRPPRNGFVAIDTRFSDDGTTISLADKICDVASIKITAAEIPMSFYNISKALGNNCFGIYVPSATTITMVTILDGYYTTATIAAAINTALTTAGLTAITYTVSNNVSSFVIDSSLVGTYTFQFDTDATGGFDKYEFNAKLGWLLGFRAQAYTAIAGTTLLSPAFVDANPIKYVYIAVDDFSGCARPTMQCANANSQINKRILARIGIDPVQHPFGSVLVTDATYGTMVSDRRTYAGKADIQRLSVQLISPAGLPLDLHGLNFSFVIEIEYR